MAERNDRLTQQKSEALVAAEGAACNLKRIPRRRGQGEQVGRVWRSRFELGGLLRYVDTGSANVEIRSLPLLLLISLAVGSFVPAAEITVSQLLSDPLTFDRRHVTVSGTAQTVETGRSGWRYEYVTFQLCEQPCVKVFAVGLPQVTEGKRVTVNGQFEADTAFGPFMFHDDILMDKGSP